LIRLRLRTNRLLVESLPEHPECQDRWGWVPRRPALETRVRMEALAAEAVRWPSQCNEEA